MLQNLDNVNTYGVAYAKFHCPLFVQNPNDKELNLQYNLIRPYVRADCSTTIHDLKLLVCSYFTKYEEATVDIYACSTKHVSLSITCSYVQCIILLLICGVFEIIRLQ